MKSILLFGWVLLALVGCNPAGPQFPPGADETYDWGIKYARFGDEWWSVRNGEKWNKVYLSSAYFTTAPQQFVHPVQFGPYAQHVESLTRSSLSDQRNEDMWLVHFKSGTADQCMQALNMLWNRGHIREIRMRCYKGCYIAL